MEGLARSRHGAGFVYLDRRGRRVRDHDTLERIRKLAIPPAWNDVWICPVAEGHIQARGRDARGRRQYRYEARWLEIRSATKFHRMIDFAAALPRIRAACDHDLRRRTLSREKVLATLVSLLELTHIRVGNEEYTR
ncbi:MAG TPA: DNA topoisomerase IB, partial [Polyangiaceae bacterium]|nr:DNA topoisomerase IB [Polyangiaceae bacterium]